MLAVIRVRGTKGLREEKIETLKLLRLGRVNHCVLVPSTPNFTGMVKRVSEYVTWGEVKEPQLEKLILKRGRKKGDVKLPAEEAKKIAKQILKDKSVKTADIKPVFRLSPPKKGYKATRLTFPKGDLGYRGDKINDLLDRMI